MSQNRGLQLSVVTDGTYSIKVNNKVWLTSAPTYFMADGLMHINGNLSLKQSSATSGYDKIGEWQTTDFYYTVGSSNITASIKTYPFELENDFIVFSQVMY